jgi:uncharacterized protein YheU (UPF0270 family)
MQTDHHEEGVEIPWDRIDPDTLRNMISEFVTREWAELSDSGYTLDKKIGQVLRQLQDKKARVVFDLSSQTCNIVVCR